MNETDRVILAQDEAGIMGRLAALEAEYGPKSEIRLRADGGGVYVELRALTDEEERLSQALCWLTVDCGPLTAEEEAWAESVAQRHPAP